MTLLIYARALNVFLFFLRTNQFRDFCDGISTVRIVRQLAVHGLRTTDVEREPLPAKVRVVVREFPQTRNDRC